MHVLIHSTNALERLNQEVRRRERVIRIFPNNRSATRLIGAILMDKVEEYTLQPSTLHGSGNLLCIWLRSSSLLE